MSNKIPDASKTIDLWGDVEERCRRHASAVVYKAGKGSASEEVTYGELVGRVRTLSASVQHRFPGNSFCVLLPNSHYHVDLFFAAAATRKNMVCLNHRLAAEELQVLFNKGSFCAVVSSSAFAGLLSEMCFEVTGIRTVIWVGPPPHDMGGSHTCSLSCPPGCTCGIARLEQGLLEELYTQGNGAEFRPAPVSPDCKVQGFWTSGTTGTPKEVAHSHSMVWHHTVNSIEALGLREGDGDCWGHFGPLFHCGTPCFVWMSLFLGARQVFHENQFQFFEVAEMLVSEGVTIVKLMPTILKYLFSAERTRSMSFPMLKWVLTGGMKPTQEIISDTRSVLGCDFLQGYGMTENTCHIAFKNESREPLEGGLTIVPGLDVKILDESGREVGVDVVGEICLKGPTLFAGYENNDEATASSFAAGGYFRGGDLGRLDANGKLFISGRSKDMIIVGGENVFAVEVEQAIAKLPGVMRVAVFGVEDEALGEVVHCALVAIPDGPLASEADDAIERQVIRRCRENLAPFKVPSQCHVWREDFPMTGSGKPIKHEIRAASLAEAGSRASAEAAAHATKEDAVLGVLMAVLDRDLGPDELEVPFVELGMASVDFTRVINMLSEVLVGRLSPALLFENESPRALVDYVNACDDLALRGLEEVESQESLQAAVDPDPELAWASNPWRALNPISLVLQVLLLLVRPLVYTAPILAASCAGYALAVVAREALAEDDYGWAVLAFALMPLIYPASLLTLMVAACLAKWLLIGRAREQVRPMWGPYYCRWLCCYNLFQSLDPLLALFRGTTVLVAFYRMCGAKISSSAELHTSNLTDCDLVEIGPGAFVDRACNLQPSRLGASKGGYLVLGRVSVGANCRVGYGACLPPRTSLGAGAQLRPLQVAGPAAPAGHAAAAPPPRRGRASGLEAAIATYVAGALVVLAVGANTAVLSQLERQVETGARPLRTLVPLALVDALEPGAELAELADGMAQLAFWALVPLSIFFVVPHSYFALVLLAKRLVIGARDPAQTAETRWRRWASRLYVCLIDCPLFRIATQQCVMSHLTKVQYQLLGAKIGRRAYFCAPFVPDPELVEIGDNVICAGNVALLTTDACTGTSAEIRLRDSSIVANTVVLMSGVEVGVEAMVGDAIAVLTGERLASRVLAIGDNSGKNPYFLVRRPVTKSPPQVSDCYYAACQLMLVGLELLLNVGMHVPGYVAIGAILQSARDSMQGTVLEEWGTWIMLPVGLLVIMTSKIVLIVVAKWCLAGSFRPGEIVLFGARYATWIALEAALFDGDVLFLQSLCGTAMLAGWYRLMGARVGSNACLMGSSVGCEYDLKNVGSGSVVNHGSLLFSHSVERGTLIFRHTALGQHAEVGVNCVVEAGAMLPEGDRLRHHQVAHNAAEQGEVGHRDSASSRTQAAAGARPMVSVMSLVSHTSSVGGGEMRAILTSGHMQRKKLSAARESRAMMRALAEGPSGPRKPKPEMQLLDKVLNLDDFEGAARAVLANRTFDYYRGGAADEWTLSENRSAFEKYMIVPRVLVPVKDLQTDCTFWGVRLRFPILVAPTAMHLQAHEEAEVATAKATVRAGSAMILSSLSNCSLEQVAGAVPHDPATQLPTGLMFQLYVFKRRDVTEAIVRKAAKAGYKALVLTVDAPITGRRECDIRNGFSTSDSMGQLPIIQMLGSSPNSQLVEFEAQKDLTLDWSIIPWLKSISGLPVIAKGIMHPEDAALAVEAGASGVVVSNHGGRQLDSSPATIDVLEGVVAAVRGRVPVLVDGGFRRGTDVFKALALGADGVLLGRPVVYALAAGGQAGVVKMLRLLQEELQATMRLAGCASLAEIQGRLHRPEMASRGPALAAHAANPNGQAQQPSQLFSLRPTAPKAA